MRAEFEQEVERWIEEEILTLESEDATTGVLALMGVVQLTKSKVRPVRDYRELNKYVSCHSGGEMINECSETILKRRQMTGAFTIVNLKAAYTCGKEIVEIPVEGKDIV